LEFSLTTKHEGAGSTHVEFALDEGDPQLIGAIKRHESVRHVTRCLPFADIADCDTGHALLLGACTRDGDRYALCKFRARYPGKEALRRFSNCLRRLRTIGGNPFPEARSHQTSVHRIHKFLDKRRFRAGLLAAYYLEVVFVVPVQPPAIWLLPKAGARQDCDHF
jgi:hypothetical protein